jgi:signal transduction histidine kinase
MPSIKPSLRPSGRWSLSPQARSTTRLALVACTVVATVGVLVIVTLQARRAEQALDDASAQTLRDYTGYAGRMVGAEVLRRFAEQRAAILSPVVGSARRAVAAPSLADIIRRGDAYFAAFPWEPDSGLGYFRLDARTGRLEGTGAMRGPLAARVVDTLRIVLATKPRTNEPEILALTFEGVPRSVAFARLVGPNDTLVATYGFTYTRALGVSAIADRVFRETPLLPTSYSGSRWNYDIPSIRSADISNDSFLGMRIADRAGHVLWQSKGAAAASTSPYRERVVLSTITGGLIVETALLPAGEPSLIPGIVRRAQRWSLGALLAITAMLAAVSLVALGGERLGVRARRAEAMKQLALGLRHELNNALASVMLNAELLREEMLDPSQRERLDSIVEQADRMRSVLRRLEKTDRLNVVVPYLNEGYMVDLSETVNHRTS